MPQPSFRWDEQRRKREPPAVRDTFEVQGAGWWLKSVRDLPAALRPDPAIRRFHPIGSGLLMLHDLGNAQGFENSEAAILRYALLIWTRHMNDIAMHTAYVPQGCEHTLQSQPAVTLGAGTIWMQAYDAVTTRSGKYVQGGGCTTVDVAGLIQSGGFGSYSKHYGLAAGGLLEAEVVTADGKIRVANACTNPDLFWALKGGGGGLAPHFTLLRSR
jgi:hypothetical protein